MILIALDVILICRTIIVNRATCYLLLGLARHAVQLQLSLDISSCFTTLQTCTYCLQTIYVSAPHWPWGNAASMPRMHMQRCLLIKSCLLLCLRLSDRYITFSKAIKITVAMAACKFGSPLALHRSHDMRLHAPATPCASSIHVYPIREICILRSA